MKTKKQLERIEDYLLKKDKNYGIYGVTRAELLKEVQITEDELQELYKQKKIFTVHETAKLILKIEEKEV